MKGLILLMMLSFYFVHAQTRDGQITENPKTGAPLRNNSTYTWYAVGSGANATVNAIEVNGGEIFAGGNFDTIGGIYAKGVAKWNGSSWSVLGSGLGTDLDGAISVNALAWNGTDLYAGGMFLVYPGGNPTHGIAKWTGSAWSRLGTGNGVSAGSPVAALGQFGSTLFVGGYFNYVYDGPGYGGDILATGLASWNGTNWSIPASPGPGGVSSITSDGTDLYVGGSFTNIAGVSANRIAKWNGSTWSALGDGLNGSVNAIACDGNDVYVGGSFTAAGGNPADYIAKWDGSVWSALGSGLNSPPHAIVISGGDVYVGGSFTIAGGISADYFAKWNGSNWVSIGGPNTTVYALKVQPQTGSMIVGGAFTSVNGIPNTSRIARFTDSNNSLPVEIVGLSAIAGTGSVELHWSTATETDNYGFDVERKLLLLHSVPGVEVEQWIRAGFVAGRGNSNAPSRYSFADKNLKAGTYAYRLKQIDRDGHIRYSESVRATANSLPNVFSLEQNYPNPFNPLTTIRYALPVPARVNIDVYNALGELVSTLVDEDQSGGLKEVQWNAEGIPSGVYFCRMVAGTFAQTTKLVLMK